MIKSRFTLKQLETFVHVADTGTFRKAAAALGTTQPNVSVRIAALEHSLDATLMRRDAGSVTLTETGEQVLAAARAVLREAEGVLEIAKRRDLVEARLRLGVTELVAATWLHTFLRALRLDYPALRVELIVDLAVEVENLLSEGQLDLAILNEPFRTPVTGKIPLGSTRYGWCATPDLVAKLGLQPDLRDLFAQGILSHGKETQASVALRRAVAASGLRAEEITHSSSLTACLHMAIDGMGIALLPREMFIDLVATGTLVQVDCPWQPAPLSFVARYDAERAPLFVIHAAELSARVAGDARQ